MRKTDMRVAEREEKAVHSESDRQRESLWICCLVDREKAVQSERDRERDRCSQKRLERRQCSHKVTESEIGAVRKC